MISDVSVVRNAVSLLLKRPITEAIAMQVKAMNGFRHLTISDGEWDMDRLEGDIVTTGEQHGWTEALLLTMITNFVLRYKLGRVYPGDITFVLSGEDADIRVTREPDIAFVSKARVKSTPGFIYLAPDLAVEIISPSQSYQEMVAKAHEYFDYGTKQVWIVLPHDKLIDVYNPDGTFTRYGVADTISGGDLLPGFTLAVASIFED